MILWLDPKAQKKSILTSGSIPYFRFGVSCKEQVYHLLAPKVSAGHLRRDRTKAVTERSLKTPLVARSLRAFHPLSDPLPPPVQCGGCCALHATMVYSDVILLYSIQQASGLPDRTAKIADEVTSSARAPGAGVQNSGVFCARSASAGVVTRYFSLCLIFWCFWIKPKAQEKNL